MSLAPIVILAYNRPDKLERLIKCLGTAELAIQSDVFVFIDGPKSNTDVTLQLRILEIVQGNSHYFQSLEVHHRRQNVGLSSSVITGVTKVLNTYESAIVLEDDLVVHKQFLSFMNGCLDRYKDNEEIMSINGYGLKVPLKCSTAESSIYLTTRNFSWGWAVWRDRWNDINWDLKDWTQVKSKRQAFNKYCGDDCFRMLNRWKKGSNDSWAIRFCYHQFLNNKLTVAPYDSLIVNDGFDDSGENCREWSRFQSNLATGPQKFIFPAVLCKDEKTINELHKYHTLTRRILVRLRWMLR